MRALANFVMQGGRQATLVVATMALLSILLPPIGILSAAALALYTLREGPVEGMRVITGSVVAAAGLGYLLIGTPWIAVSYLLLLWFPVWLAAAVLRQTASLGRALETVVFLGVIGVLGVYLFTGGPADIWQDVLKTVLDSVTSDAELPLSEAEIGEAIRFWSQYLTGMVIGGTIMSLTLGLMLGRWWQDLLFNPGGFKSEFKQLRSQKIIGVATVILLAMALVSRGMFAELAWNICIQLGVLYTLVGLGLVHFYMTGTKKGRVWLVVLYVLIFFIPHMVLPIMVLGLSDVWMDWRLRYAPKRDGSN